MKEWGREVGTGRKQIQAKLLISLYCGTLGHIPLGKSGRIT